MSKRRLLQAAERANHALRAMQVQGRRLLLQGLPGLPIRTAARVRCMHIPLAPRSESLRLCVQKKAWKLGHKLSCVPTSLASQEGHAQQIAKYVTRGLEQAGRPNQTASGRRRYAPIAESDFVTKFAELDAAEDWRGMLELADEAGAWISKVRRTRPSAAASIAQKMGLVHQRLRSFEGAIAFHLQFKAIAEGAGTRMKREVGWACGNLGICYQKIGENALAISFTEHDRNIAQEFGDRAGVAAACGNLGVCLEGMGQFDKAIALHEEAKAIYEEEGDRDQVRPISGNMFLSVSHVYVRGSHTVSLSGSASQCNFLDPSLLSLYRSL